MQALSPDTGYETIDAILLAARTIRTSADNALRERGLSLSGYKLLRALADRDRSMRELSEALHVSPRTMTDLVDGLELRGLVLRGSHPHDRRVCLIGLKEAGRTALADARDVVTRVHEAELCGLTTKEQATLLRLLAKAGLLPGPEWAEVADSPRSKVPTS